MSGLRVAGTYRDFLTGRTRPFDPGRDGPPWHGDDPPDSEWGLERDPLAKSEDTE